MAEHTKAVPDRLSATEFVAALERSEVLPEAKLARGARPIRSYDGV